MSARLFHAVYLLPFLPSIVVQVEDLRVHWNS